MDEDGEDEIPTCVSHGLFVDGSTRIPGQNSCSQTGIKSLRVLIRAQKESKWTNPTRLFRSATVQQSELISMSMLKSSDHFHLG